MLPLVVVSPHLDDAALSCGSLLAATPGSVVVTVFAGGRPSWERATDWDRLCGFADGEDVVAARRQEDAAALTPLDARPVWLPFPELEYRSDLDLEPITSALADVLRSSEGQQVAVPLGLHHEDHHVTHAVGIAAARAAGYRTVLLYADYYDAIVPGVLPPRLEKLRTIDPTMSEVAVATGRRSAKRRALRAYRSQRAGLGRHFASRAARRPERFWRYDIWADSIASPS